MYAQAVSGGRPDIIHSMYTPSCIYISLQAMEDCDKNGYM